MLHTLTTKIELLGHIWQADVQYKYDHGEPYLEMIELHGFYEPGDPRDYISLPVVIKVDPDYIGEQYDDVINEIIFDDMDRDHDE